MHFSIGNATFTLTSRQYLLILRGEEKNICYTVFQGVNLHDRTGSLIWILGDYFLSRFYSVYDLHRNQVGLAKSISYDYLQASSRSSAGNARHPSTHSCHYALGLLLALSISRQ